MTSPAALRVATTPNEELLNKNKKRQLRDRFGFGFPLVAEAFTS
jgi:hypothetical protein